MLPNCGYFNRIRCPDANSGTCDRPFCHFGDHSSEIPESHPSSTNGIQTNTSSNDSSSFDDQIPSYSTVPTEHFQGYHGYFATSSSPPPAVPKRPLLPTPTIASPIRSGNRNVQPIRPKTNQQSFNRKLPTNNSVISSQPAKNSSPQSEANLNVLARGLAAINNEIERLQKKLNNSDEQLVGDDATTANTDDSMTVVDSYDPEHATADADSISSANLSSDDQYRPKSIPNSSSASTAGSKSAYKPTPIEELQKMGKPKNKLLKDNWAIVDNETKNSAVALSKADKKQLQSKKVVSKKPPTLMEKKKAPGIPNPISQLFGEDSDSETGSKSLPKIPRKVTSKTTSSSHSKDDHDDMASIIDELIAPTSSIPPNNRGKAETTTKESASTSNSINDKKRRTANLPDESIEKAKKLRTIGGERPKGHVLTPREQLEFRLAQLKKDVKDIETKQQKSVDVLKKQVCSSTVPEIGTHPKGEKRLARLPKTDIAESKPGLSEQPLERPTIPVEIGAKVPSKVRQQYLNLIIDEYLKSHGTQEAYRKAEEEEKSVYTKAISRASYVNAVACTIKRIRDKESSSLSAPITETKQSNTKIASSGISHNAVIGGKQAMKHSYTLGRSGGSQSSTQMSGEAFYDALSSFVITIEQQIGNGFPRPDPERPGFALYQKAEIKKMYVSDEELKRICIRCGKLYQLTPELEYIASDECIFHWGRAWKKRVAGAFELRYTCCQDDLNSVGCSMSRYHVTDCMPQRALNGYLYTSDVSPRHDSSKAFSLDCEMVYTTCGNELARVTVVNDQLRVVYERCVRPEHTILDYNTRFSGLTEEVLGRSDVAKLEDVQKDLSNLFTSDSILIGHSLESDFRALKLIHDKVVDTSIVFPHRLGSPYKKALRTLATEFLNKIIQNDIDGHDSKEDATTCMELMKWRIKQDAGRSKR